MPVVNYDWDELEDNIVEEYDDAGATIADYTTEPDHFGNVISQHRGGQSSFFHYDGQGSTLVVTDETQNVTDTRAYSAFGETTEATEGTTLPSQYVGEHGYYRDESTGQYLARRRPYEPLRVRWIAVDPLHFDTNAYLFVTNSPNARVDVSGLQWECMSPVTPTFELLGSCNDQVCSFLQNPAFADLVRCAIQRGCLRAKRAVFCTTCTGEVAAYVHGPSILTFFAWDVFGPRIEVCYSEWNAQATDQDRQRYLFEELYHALTICDYGGSLHRAQAIRDLMRLHSRFAAAGRPTGWNVACLYCYAQEILAKACARRASGDGFPFMNVLMGEVHSSCITHHCPEYTAPSVAATLFNTWYSTSVLNACFDLDVGCAGVSDVAPITRPIVFW